MVNILNNNKRVFWEALILTVVIFLFGMLLGVAFESSKLTDINDYYIRSETSIMDAFALSAFSEFDSSSCDVLKQSNLDFADNIYEEAILLEDFEQAGKITESMKIMHKKYDVLRTFLWINTIKTADKCGRNYNTVVYLYISESEDLTKKATQNVWSKVLYDLKQDQGENILLIPLAVDKDLVSLGSILKGFDIPQYPAVIINEEVVLTELISVEEIKVYLN
jgi:hypothetical protein